METSHAVAGGGRKMAPRIQDEGWLESRRGRADNYSVVECMNGAVVKWQQWYW